MKSTALAGNTYPAEYCRAKGFTTVTQFAEHTKMRAQTVIDLLLCRPEAVFLKDGGYTLGAQEFALFIGIPADMLFGEYPDEEKRRREAEQAFAELHVVQPIKPLDHAILENLKETTTRVLASMTPREERILKMRFGIGMNSDHTIEEIGQQFSVTRERIRQIEAKALRKLRHPNRQRKLRSFLDNSDTDVHLELRMELLVFGQNCLEI